jgi:hypothetical protein
MLKQLTSLAILVVFIFCFLYSALYLSNRSFWLDEAYLALSIVNSTISPFEPLALYDQATPWGYLVIIKVVSIIFGEGDLQFRMPGLLVYNVACLYILVFMIKNYGAFVALLVATNMMLNPILLRYSTEFKHYVLEFSLSAVVVVSFLRLKNNEPHAKYVYAIAVIFSIFFGISNVLVNTATFLTKLLDKHFFNLRQILTSKWILFHAVYLALFTVWYIVSIRPSTIFQLSNYPVYDVNVSFASLFQVSYWFQLVDIIEQLMGSRVSFLLSLVCIAAVIIPLSNEGRILQPILILFFIVCFFVYALNIIGVLPIRLPRHFIFLLPPLYLFFAFMLSQLYSYNQQKSLEIIITVVLILFPVLQLIQQHVVNSRSADEIKTELSTIEESNRVFVDFFSQPVYQWYQRTLYNHLPDPEILVNPKSGMKLDFSVGSEDLEPFITQVGSWPTIGLSVLNNSDLLYERFIVSKIVQAPEATLVVSNIAGAKLVRELASVCHVSYRSKTIVHVACNDRKVSDIDDS